nr:zinc finger CCCH domain-containing protein 22-like isoform X3 [Ipomoea batatas]
MAHRNAAFCSAMLALEEASAAEGVISLHESNSQSPNYQVTEENSSHEASAAGQENRSGSEDSDKKQQCNSPELHKRGLEHILPGKIVAAASPVKSAGSC